MSNPTNKRPTTGPPYVIIFIILALLGGAIYAWWPWSLIVILAIGLIALFAKKKRSKDKPGASHKPGGDDDHHDPKQDEWKWKLLEFVVGILVIGVAVFAVMQARGMFKDYLKHREKMQTQLLINVAPGSAPLPPSVALDPEYPSSGEEFLDKNKGLQATLDPLKTHMRGNKPVKYCLAIRPSFCHVDDFSGRNDDKWWKYPKGRYLVTTEGTDVFFRWWQD